MTFSQAISKEDQAKVTFDVKKGSVKKNVTAKWAENGESVELESAIKFAEGEYIVTVSGLEFVENGNMGKVTVEAQKIVSVEIPANELKKAAAAEVKYVVKDNFGIVVDVLAKDFTWTIIDKTDNSVVVANASGATDKILKLNTNPADIGHKIMVTGILKSDTAVKVVKELTVSNISSALTLESVVLPEGATRIVQNAGYVEVKYALQNSIGETLKLSQVANNANKDNVDGIKFISSDEEIIKIADASNNFTVDEKGVLKFKVLNKAGDVTITALDPSTGNTSDLVIKVEKTAFPSDIEMIKQPDEEITVGAGGVTNIRFDVYDQYGDKFTKDNPPTGKLVVTKKSGGDAIIDELDTVNHDNDINDAKMIEDIEIKGKAVGEETLTFQIVNADGDKLGKAVSVHVKVIAEIDRYEVKTEATEFIVGDPKKGDIKITVTAQDTDPKTVPVNRTLEKVKIDIGGKDVYLKTLTFRDGVAEIVLPAKTAFNAQPITVTDAAGKTGNKAGITVKAGVPVKFSVKQGTDAKKIKITAVDQAANTAESYDGDFWIKVTPFQHNGKTFDGLTEEGLVKSKVTFTNGATNDVVIDSTMDVPSGTYTVSDEEGLTGTYVVE